MVVVVVVVVRGGVGDGEEGERGWELEAMLRATDVQSARRVQGWRVGSTGHGKAAHRDQASQSPTRTRLRVWATQAVGS